MRRVAVLLILTCCFVSTATAQVHVDHEDMTLIRSVPPRYPLEAREIRLQGVVVMDIVIDVEEERRMCGSSRVTRFSASQL